MTVRRALRLVLGLGRWRVVCPDCGGTGICKREGSRHPHSCCGDCDRRLVPRSAVPDDFSPDHLSNVLLGTGWIWGSFWQGLFLGFYRRKNRALVVPAEARWESEEEPSPSRVAPDGVTLTILGKPPAEPVLRLSRQGRDHAMVVLLAADRAWLREQLAAFDHGEEG
jgi:hypothetical protein